MRSSLARGTKVTPVLRYRNPRAAAQWLCDAFGFSEHETVQDADGHVRYVLLRLGASFVMVRPVADLGFDDLLVQPQAVGGANTQVCYVTVADVEAHRVRSGHAGAKIEIEPQDDGLGGQFYTCRDLEGHLWSFGTRTYGLADAESGQAAIEGGGTSQPSTALTVVRSSPRRRLLPGAAIAAVIAVLALGIWVAYRTFADVRMASAAQIEGVMQQLAQERKRLAAAQDAAQDAAARLAKERADAGDLRQALQQSQTQLSTERQRRSEAEEALGSMKAVASELEQAGQRGQSQIAEASAKAAQEEARAKSATEKAAALQAQIDRLQQARNGEQEELRKTREALLDAQVALEILRGANAAPVTGSTSPPPAVTAGQTDAEKLAAQPLDGPHMGESEPGKVGEPEVKSATAKLACASAVQGKIPFGARASKTWAEANLERLCRGAETSLEPARCFEELMSGKVSWGGGSAWSPPNALALCAGSRNARQTIDCFAAKLAAVGSWRAAIKECKGGG